ncbi:MAG: phage terminase large subunit family protein, partial [Bryobacteraceae bacterium]|nr:phage terminase large subunit family protein [Bryobacteraceae bacterium]
RPVGWFEQLLSETLVTTYSKGVPVREWRPKKGVRTEALDARVYAYAALCGLVSMGLRVDAEAERVAAFRLAAGAGTLPTSKPSRTVLRSHWIESGDRRF